MEETGSKSELEVFFNRATKHVASKLASVLDNATLLSLYARFVSDETIDFKPSLQRELFRLEGARNT